MEKAEEKYLSIQTYMELLQSAQNKTQHKRVKDFLSSSNVEHFKIVKELKLKAFKP